MSYGSFGANDLLQGLAMTSMNTDASNSLSIVCWVKKSAAEWAASENYAVTFNASSSSEDNRVSLWGASENMRAQARTTSSAGNAYDTASAYDDTWVVCVGTFAQTSRTTYVENSSNASTTSTSTKTLTGLDNLRIGHKFVSYNPFQGKIAEIAIFDKVLSSAEIDALQTGSETGPAPNTVASGNCVAYYPLDTDQASHADQSGTGNDALDEAGDVAYDADHPTITSATSIPIFHHHYDKNLR